MNSKKLVLGFAAILAAVSIPFSALAEEEDLCDALTSLCDEVNQEERVECKESCPQTVDGYEGYELETGPCFMECNVDYHDFKELVCDNVSEGGGDGEGEEE